MGGEGNSKIIMMQNVNGGLTSYEYLVGILMSDSIIPRIPGDPGHAETFSFPVLHQVLKGFPFDDLINIDKSHMDILMDHVRSVERRGVSLIAADCGLFGPFQNDIRAAIKVPFIGSSLDMIPLLQKHLPSDQKIGILTGSSRILSDAHLSASGIDPNSVVIAGMDESPEFNRVVLDKSMDLNVELLKAEVENSVTLFSDTNIGAIVLECTNLISFRSVIQYRLKVPVFDLVSYIEFFISGFALREFNSQYIR